jgi:hypothetical protein
MTTMSDNPLEESPERDARIRERAYHLWMADGCPHGQAEVFWERARELIGMEDSAGAGLLPNPMTQHEPLPGVTVDEAALQENLGEFPSLMTDQGDRIVTPMAKKAPAKQAAAKKAPAKKAPAKARTGRTRPSAPPEATP